jgi:hypothetical protein
MTNKSRYEPAENTKRIARLLAERMPHLEFAFWDLSEFMPAFHNVRRNMIFIECESLAHKEVISSLAADPKLRNYLVYSGERKPVAINEEWASAKSTKEIRDVIAVIARRDFKETDVFEKNARIPSLERQLVDLMAYSLRGYLPIALDEAVDAFAWHVKRNAVRITYMQRYATRRYMGWFLDILLYKLAEEGKIMAVDPRYLENGRRYYEAILRVGKA